VTPATHARSTGPWRSARASPRAPAPCPGPSLAPDFHADHPDTRVYVGDCRCILPDLPEARAGAFDLIFADPPFNWNRDYDRLDAGGADVVDAESPDGAVWTDDLPREDYLRFTHDWIDRCAEALRPGGTFWINIPDDTAAEIVVHLKNARRFRLVNWCIWHYRFGQNRRSGFINSKVHALCFVKPGGPRTWNPEPILEPSDRASIYADPRTQRKRDGMPPGLRVPMDVWYGPWWGRVQGNNRERRPGHDNQLPEAYLERVLLSTSNEGDLVLDPFLGSGTTGTVARAYGRRFVGVEYSAANAASAWERITRIGMVAKGRALGRANPIFPARGGRGGRSRGRAART
jgi:DNA modification methylase